MVFGIIIKVHNSRQNQNESFSNEAINSSTCNHDSIKSNRLSGGSGSFVTVPADLVCSVPVDSSPVPVVTKKEKDKKVKKASVKKDMSGLNAEFESRFVFLSCVVHRYLILIGDF